MSEIMESEKGRSVCASRVELVHMITNLIEGADIKELQDRDAAAMLAIHIVDGLEEEVDKLEARVSAARVDKYLPPI